MLTESIFLTQVGGQIPIMPTVITAKGDFVLAGVSSGNSYCHGHGLPAAAGVAHHLGPGVQLAQQLGQLYFFRAVERTARSIGDGLFYRLIDFRVRIAQYIGPDTPYECTCPNLAPGEGAPTDAC